MVWQISTISPITSREAEGMAMMISSTSYFWTSRGISSRRPSTGRPNMPIRCLVGLSSTNPTGIRLSRYRRCFNSRTRVAPASPAPTMRTYFSSPGFLFLNRMPRRKRQEKREKPISSIVAIQCKAGTLRGSKNEPSRALLKRIKKFTIVAVVIEAVMETSSPTLAYCHSRL